jgi:hypothetical protein
MRWSLISFVGICLLIPACSTQRVSKNADAELYREAFSPSWGGAIQKGFRYRGRNLLVVFKCHTSGVATSEPFVFVQTTDGWHCLYHHATERFEMDATVEGDRLLLWRMEWPGDKLQRTEYWSYDLRHLDAASYEGSSVKH